MLSQDLSWCKSIEKIYNFVLDLVINIDYNGLESDVNASWVLPHLARHNSKERESNGLQRKRNRPLDQFV